MKLSDLLGMKMLDSIFSCYIQTGLMSINTLGDYPRYRAATLWNLTNPWTLFDVLFF